MFQIRADAYTYNTLLCPLLLAVLIYQLLKVNPASCIVVRNTNANTKGETEARLQDR